MWKYIPGRRKPHDSWAYVLDVYGEPRRAQVVGDRYFILMEFYVRPGVSLEPTTKVYVGKGQREHVSRFLRYLSFSELRGPAQGNLEEAVKKAVTEGEAFFVQFFNESRPVTTRLHQRELLPGVGKKLLMKILEERRKRPFLSYSDVEERTGLRDPAGAIQARVIEELTGDERYLIFVAHKRIFEEEEMLL